MGSLDILVALRLFSERCPIGEDSIVERPTTHEGWERQSQVLHRKFETVELRIETRKNFLLYNTVKFLTNTKNHLTVEM